MKAPGRRALVLEHAPGEGPGRIAGALTAAGFHLDRRRLHRGDALPAALASDELLVVMGGPMGVGDTHDARYPFLAAELDLLAHAIAHDRAVLGICLGAQLLAAAAGAQVARNRHHGRPQREVGWASVTFATGPHPELNGVPARAPMLHWHQDAAALPAGAIRLAWSERCPLQAFRLTRSGARARQAGVQFHPEVEAATVSRWALADAAFVHGAGGMGAVARLRHSTARQEARSRTPARRLLANLIICLAGPG